MTDKRESYKSFKMLDNMREVVLKKYGIDMNTVKDWNDLRQQCYEDAGDYTQYMENKSTTI